MSNEPGSRAQPSGASALLERARAEHQAGRLETAASMYREVLAAEPGNADALHMLGTLKTQGGAAEEGEKLIASAIALKPDDARFWVNHGHSLVAMQRNSEATSSYRRAIELAPDMVIAYYSLIGHLIRTGHSDEALTAADAGLKAVPNHHVLATGKGNALSALRRYSEAVAAFDQAISTSPRNVDALGGKGLALLELRQWREALASFDAALALVPGHLDSVVGRALALVQLGRPAEALAVMDRVVAVVPRHPGANYVRGHAQLALFQTAQAVESFATAAATPPPMVEALQNQADALRNLGRYSEALAIYKRVRSLAPDLTHGIGGLAAAALYCCEWQTVAELAPQLEQKVREGSRGIDPFTFLMISGSPELHLECATTFTRNTCPPVLAAPATVKATRRGKLRVAYLSSDFRSHATAFLTAELFGLHDRSRFEVFGISTAPGDDSQILKRIKSGVDQFHDMALSSNADIDALVRRLGVDIAIDLKGHTGQSRIGALASRPAPIQATYLGYPGSSGAPFIDYAIVDAIVAPAEHQRYYSEALVRLPLCYQVNDRQRAISTAPQSRARNGLPENAFVFCCFNTNYKITAEFFSAWMRMLKACDGSVLWLVKSNEAAARNLKRRASELGVEPERIVFADMADLPAHLARHKLADLALDTLPYNAHTTGSDALWAGLPMVTCKGNTFAGRVGASLLTAAGLPELVTDDLAAYEALAIALAKDRSRLEALRQRLLDSLTRAPLFDTDLFRRHLESGLQTMQEIALRGEAPRSFAVDRLA